MTIKRIFCMLLCLPFAAAFSACTASGGAETAAGGTGEATASGPVKATITMKELGDITLELYPDKAPQSVYNFVELAKSGFYDGLTFHRVMKGFMIQGGDPSGDGSGGPGYTIKGEFKSNGVPNDISHVRGVLSMARRSQPLDSAGSQFFIVHEDSTFLDGEYAAFGRVTEGMEVVDAIVEVAVDSGCHMPYEPVVIETITIEGGDGLPSPEKLK